MTATRPPETTPPSPDTVSVESLSRVGQSTAKKLQRLGLHTMQDLLFHLPLRYEDRTRITPMGRLRPGVQAVVVGRIDLADVVYGRRRALVVRFSDGTGSLTMRLFYFSRAQRDNLKVGHYVRCFGEARSGARTLEMIHPEYSVTEQSPSVDDLQKSLTPVYPATEGITQRQLRTLIEQSLQRSEGSLIDWLEETSWSATALPTLPEALDVVHKPPVGVDLAALAERQHPAQRRLAFEELLAHHLSLRQLREARREDQALPVKVKGKLYKQFLKSLPFSLTGAQTRVIDETVADMAQPSPAMRLIQGDVGSGKTVVAAAAALYAVEAGLQVAIMAPTELLAEQHARSFRAWFEPLGLHVESLIGKTPAAERRRVLATFDSGECQVAVGTHALFQSGVEFHKLGLVVVDEQHRFGVGQRYALLEKGREAQRLAHQITMTATPIPRTMAMVFYADVDVSAIDELPPGRQAIETVVMVNDRRDQVIHRVRSACAQGRQVYWVCPLIDESDVLEAQAATETETTLRDALPDLSIGLVHGRLKSGEKDQIMTRFRDGDVQLLVATTVIEVGVDVPNASLMIIENAERLGLSQLHQLRGRVGRGSERSVCVLLYQRPLSRMARARLATMRETTDGFEIARRDLDQRGPGEVLGTRQTGAPQLRVADLARDSGLIPDVERVAGDLLKRDGAGQDIAVQALINRWVGQSIEYGNV